MKNIAYTLLTRLIRLSKVTQLTLFTYLTILLIGCTSTEIENSSIDPGSPDDAVISISKSYFKGTFTQLTERVLIQEVSARGYVEVPPNARVEVSPYYGGYVQDIDLLPGQEVKKGQLLFTLRNPEYLKMQQEWLEVREQLGYLEADFKRQQQLAEEEIASEKNFRKAESDYKVMRARYESLTEQLKLMNIPFESLKAGSLTNSIAIYATISGYVLEVEAVKGKFIDASEYALGLVNTDHLHLDLQVFEQDVIRMKEGQSIRFQVPESGQEWYAGEVHLIGKEVHPEQRTVMMHGHIREEDEDLLIPGMFVEAQIEVQSDTVWALPISAVKENEGKMFVTVKEGETDMSWEFRMVEVEIGKSNEEWVEIASEELQGKEIVAEGLGEW